MFDLSFFNLKAQKCSESFFIAGCDEVGRGPLAGPVVAACATLVVKKFDQKEVKALLRKWAKFGITDSKELNSNDRKDVLSKFSMLTTSIDQIHTFSYSENIHLQIIIKEIHASKIDEINILQASLLAMKEAVYECSPMDLPGTVLIDGNKKFKCDEDHIELEAIVKGDAKSLLIGLASIAAKEYRDQYMSELAEKFPGYGWETNAGYPTKRHLEAIGALGVTEVHRLTFRGVKEVYEERGYARS